MANTLAAVTADQRESPEIAPAYLFAGGDEAKLDATLARLRARAEDEGGPGSLISLVPRPGSGAGPDADGLIAAIPALSLTAGRRYLVADGVERWSAKQAAPVATALAQLPPDLTVVLVARELTPKLKAPKSLADAVVAAGGELRSYAAPKARELPRWLADEARRRGLELEPGAAELLAERLGDSTVRLATELDRLAVWADESGSVALADLEAMVADTSEEAFWSLSDAIIERDPATALAAAERLADQGEGVSGLIYQAAKRLREASQAVEQLEAGTPAGQVAGTLSMHPYAAKKLVRRVEGRSAAEIRAATCAIADLEWWSRGGADYPEPIALTLAVRRAAGG